MLTWLPQEQSHHAAHIFTLAPSHIALFSLCLLLIHQLFTSSLLDHCPSLKRDIWVSQGGCWRGGVRGLL
jgi:hypothetical protein